MEKYIGRMQAARRLHCSKEEIDRILESGLVEYHRTDDMRYRISVQSLDEYQASQAEDRTISLSERIQQLEHEVSVLQKLLINNGIAVPEFPKYNVSSYAPLSALGVKVSILHIFEKNGITSMEQLASLTEEEFGNIKGVGRKTTEEVKWFLESHGLSFRQDGFSKLY